MRKVWPQAWPSLGGLAGAAALLLGLMAAMAAGRAEAATPVVTETIRLSEFYEHTRVYAGRTEPVRAAVLGFKHAGELASVTVDLGSVVSQGDVVATLDTRDLSAALLQAQADVGLAQANLRAARAKARLAANTEARVRSLHKKGHASSQQYDEQRLNLEAERAQVGITEAALKASIARRTLAEVQLEQATLRAPFDGIVQMLNYDIGAQVTPGSPVLRVVERGVVEAHVGVPDLVARSLDSSGLFQIGWGSERYSASLRAVLPEVDPTTRVATAVFVLETDDVPLGVVAELYLSQRTPERGFWVPITALIESDRGLWGIYVVGEGGIAERRLVEVIHHEGQRSFVRGTLADGELIVADGVQRVVPGQAVQSVMRTASNG